MIWFLTGNSSNDLKQRSSTRRVKMNPNAILTCNSSLLCQGNTTPCKSLAIFFFYLFSLRTFSSMGSTINKILMTGQTVSPHNLILTIRLVSRIFSSVSQTLKLSKTVKHERQEYTFLPTDLLLPSTSPPLLKSLITADGAGPEISEAYLLALFPSSNAILPPTLFWLLNSPHVSTLLLA